MLSCVCICKLLHRSSEADNRRRPSRGPLRRGWRGWRQVRLASWFPPSLSFRHLCQPDRVSGIKEASLPTPASQSRYSGAAVAILNRTLFSGAPEKSREICVGTYRWLKVQFMWTWHVAVNFVYKWRLSQKYIRNVSIIHDQTDIEESARLNF